ncbi:MAG TPA: TauD/TfdA family dioxygenase [Kiloniellaceae bacterium]|nr:TauD/TfdA family dioxygenase [Kiloniellaceae bacterium]
MLEERPLTRHIGAEIKGLELAGLLEAGLEETLAGALRDALARHQVLFFRNQRLTIEQQKRLTESFGPLLRLPYVMPLEDDPEVIRVLKEADEGGGVFGGDWHSDFSFLERPPAGSVLNAIETPNVGGDTLWVSQAAAWEALPAPLQDLLLGRDAIHVGKPYGAKWAPPLQTRAGGSSKMVRGDPSADEERRHPAVLKHPLTGRLMLYLNPLYVLRLDGLTEAESQPILKSIQEHSLRPEFACRYRWQPGDLAIWDNLATQHYAVNDYHGHRRLLYRTTFSGLRPCDLAAVAPRDAEARDAEAGDAEAAA